MNHLVVVLCGELACGHYFREQADYYSTSREFSDMPHHSWVGRAAVHKLTLD